MLLVSSRMEFTLAHTGRLLFMPMNDNDYWAHMPSLRGLYRFWYPGIVSIYPCPKGVSKFIYLKLSLVKNYA